MTPEQQRIAIAEACGYSPNNYKQSHNTWTSAEIVCLPDYLNDLNAMHEAEKVLSDEEWSQYTKWILDNTAQYISKAGAPLRQVSMVHATAAQRAEAFLRTKGLWK